nr:hypothetical protein [Tanacetum cinerariifolium]
HDIRYLTDVNVNKLYKPWRSFASVINKCLTGKSSGVDSFRLSQAQMLWGFYHRINIDFAYLIWEDFIKKKGDSASSTTPPTLTPTTTIGSAPRLSATAKGKQPSRATTPTEPTDIQRTEVEQLKIVLKRSRQETQISQQRGSGTNLRTGSKTGVPDVPSDDSEEELQEEDENFDPIPRTPKESEEESNDQEEQDLRLSEEARIQEEEDADELYRDVN